MRVRERDKEQESEDIGHTALHPFSWAFSLNRYNLVIHISHISHKV
jgi:hypothetical protein